MKPTLTLMALLGATPALAHHEPHVAAFSPIAAGAALGIVVLAVLVAPRLSRATAR